VRNTHRKRSSARKRTTRKETREGVARDPGEIIRQRDAEVAKIRGFADLTEEAKERRIAEVKERARSEHRQAVEDEKRERAERLQRSRKAVYCVPVSATATDAEEAQIHAAYRSAYNDVYSSTRAPEGPEQAREELERHLHQAERSGDKLLAAAAYHRAIDLGVQSVVDEYLASRPAERRAWERYTEAAQEEQALDARGGLLGGALAKRALE
jgi:hypothetical protein